MTNEFDSKVFRAQIMIEMLPIMYREIDARGGLVRDRKQQAVEAEKPQVPVYSRILMILAVFLIAATAILAISGSAQIAKIYTEIHTLESDISSYKEKISLLRKEQSTLNDYTTINEANQNVGRVMSWNDN